MGILSAFRRLKGATPPNLPEGARAYADDDFEGHTFCVRAKRPDEDGIGATIRKGFVTNAGAEMYAAWCNGEGELDWNINGPGTPA